MEVILLLPFVFLLIALLFNMGSAWLTRMKANTAARLATSVYSVRISEGKDGAAALRAAEQVVADYYALGDDVALRVGETGSDLDTEGGGLFTGFAVTLEGWLDSLSTRQKVTLTFRGRPVVGNWLPRTEVEADWAVDGNTWTHSEIPLTFDELVKQISELGSRGEEGDGAGGIFGTLGRWALRLIGTVVGAIFKGFFWALGMIP